MQTFSTRAAARWMREHVHFADKSIKITPAYIKRLQNECRLLPHSRGLFGPRYTLAQLEKYADEVRPR